MEIKTQTANADNSASAAIANRSIPARADAMPTAAPAPSNHHAAIPAYDWVVETKPPLAYERAKKAAAIASPAAVFRRSKLCSAFTFARGTGSYSSDVSGGLRRLLPAAI